MRAPTSFGALLCAALFLVSLAPGCQCDQERPGSQSSGDAQGTRGLLSLSPQEMDQKLHEDLVNLRRYDQGLRQALDHAERHRSLFQAQGRRDLSPEQRQDIKEIWQTVLDYMRAIDGTKRYWSQFHRFNPVTDHNAHARSYLVSYLAWLIQYRQGLRFIDLTVPNKTMEKLLDEGSVQHDIPPRAFASLKYNIIHVKAVSQLLGGKHYFTALRKTLQELYGEQEDTGYAFSLIEDYNQQARAQLKERAAIQFSYNAYDIARDATFDVWFPVQTGVAEWMGDTKVRRLHQHLITHEQVEAMRQQMQPGDILVARHNWYLSNVGLPGFWPHAELYLGSPQELEAWADDPAIKEWVAAQPQAAGTLTEHLERAWPQAWAAYQDKADDGHPRRLIEAISEGVLIRSLEQGAGADYVGVLRPNYPKVEAAKAINKAFSMYGRPYDFNFDFVTDESIVCTELVYKSWQPGQDKQGPPIELVKVMGRQTLPANDLVRQFDEHYEDKQRPMDFVYFLDGHERGKGAVISNVEALRGSWKRPKWDVLQK